MAEKNSIKTKICNILRKELEPRGIHINKIIIFGSYAKKRPQKYSDIDLIIVSKDFRGKDIFERVQLTTGIGRELVYKIKKPFDIMYYSDEEWDKGHSLIINAAQKEGEIIYAR